MIEIMQYLKHFEIQETVTLVVVFKNANFSTKMCLNSSVSKNLTSIYSF